MPAGRYAERFVTGTAARGSAAPRVGLAPV